MLFATFTLRPESVAAWLAIGLAAGWLAGKVMDSPSYGTIGDLALGAIGAVVCGALLGFFVEGEPSFWVGLLLALGGACFLIGVCRIIVARIMLDGRHIGSQTLAARYRISSSGLIFAKRHAFAPLSQRGTRSGTCLESCSALP